MIQLVSAEVQVIPPSNREVWMVMMIVDGKSHAHVFPVDTVEWRMAEYGIADPGVALDVVLAEPWMKHDGLDHLSDTHLYSAASVKDARDAHLTRASLVHAEHGFTESKKSLAKTVRQQIIDESPIHDEVIAVKAELVRRARIGEQVRRADAKSRQMMDVAESSRAAPADRAAQYLIRLSEMVPGMTAERKAELNGNHHNPSRAAEA